MKGWMTGYMRIELVSVDEVVGDGVAEEGWEGCLLPSRVGAETSDLLRFEPADFAAGDWEL